MDKAEFKKLLKESLIELIQDGEISFGFSDSECFGHEMSIYVDGSEIFSCYV